MLYISQPEQGGPLPRNYSERGAFYLPGWSIAGISL